ncbi:MAG: hypothetical protein JO086_00165 [Acidimicrobiia bacterium]|nr:hypothetical protein [Acidimicrobiia bacterium]
MKIYIAARYDRRAEMAVVAGFLRAHGHQITSRWLDESHAMLDDEVAAMVDLADLEGADCLVSFTETPVERAPWAARGARHVEFGVALKSGKRLVVCGPRENIFHHLVKVEVVRNEDELVALLKRPAVSPTPGEL